MKRVIFAFYAAAIVSVSAFATSTATFIAPSPAVADDVIEAYYYHGHYYPFRHHGRYHNHRYYGHGHYLHW